jgi:hypothetical protein
VSCASRNKCAGSGGQQCDKQHWMRILCRKGARMQQEEPRYVDGCPRAWMQRSVSVRGLGRSWASRCSPASLPGVSSSHRAQMHAPSLFQKFNMHNHVIMSVDHTQTCEHPAMSASGMRSRQLLTGPRRTASPAICTRGQHPFC